ncbi:MAG: lyase family protein [Nanoarchaeota archaeon]
MDPYDSISPLDFRYYGTNPKLFEKLRCLSESAFIQYLARVEVALVETLAEQKICSQAVAEEVRKAAAKVTAEAVYKEEGRIKHNIRALVNVLRSQVSDEAKPFVHFTATSHDIICTADALRFKEATSKVLLPSLLELERTLMDIALREKATVQIGRTHGQHAEPITFGFFIAGYVSRLGGRIAALKEAAEQLKGKLSGAVGAYNASTLFFEDPEQFERRVLEKLDLKPATHSTQITEPEPLLDFVHAAVSAFGVIANLADDLRHLQRSEIGEVAEAFGTDQVGSSTMPHKRNPISFENVKSLWKAFMPRMNTLYLDQISEHQRDLTNSASMRFVPEILAGLVIAVDRMDGTLKKLVVDQEALSRNFAMSKDLIPAEPLYILLAAHNHPDAHEASRKLSQAARVSGKSLIELARKDPSLQPYLALFTKRQLALLEHPEQYTGKAAEKTEKVVTAWKKRLWAQ